MAHIYALQGPAGSGKSSTLIQVFNDLQAKYPRVTITTLHGGTTDIKVIMHNVRGLIVGIESQGDPNSRLQQSLSDFMAANCNIIFCACRTRGMTVGWVNSYHHPLHNVQFVPQTIVTRGRAGANAAMAASLITMAGL